MVKIAVLGYGGRGKIYAFLSRNLPQVKGKVKVVAVIDNNPEKLAQAKKVNKLDDDQVFLDYDEFLKSERKADVLFICTQDKQHYEHTMKALDAGYDIVLEKPVSPDIGECLAIEKKALELGRKIDVCHVLRYTNFYNKTKEVIDSGVLGDIIAIEMIENVGYWHYAHSYIRGDWRNTAESSPMILAKCCHDMDIATYLADSDCEYVASFGELKHFKKENAPEGAADRCLNGCKAKADCPYDVDKIYTKWFNRIPQPIRSTLWPYNRLVTDGKINKASLRKALEEGQFGRCVYHSDNDVVDSQYTQMRFENGINCHLIMTAYSNRIYRQIRVRGTKGELIGDMSENKLYYKLFGKKKVNIRLPFLHKFSGHGGGDEGMMRRFAKGALQTDISKSIESHLMSMAAEESRINDNKKVYIKDFKAKHSK